MKRLKEIFKDESGQGMLEYVLLMAIVVGLVLAFKDKLTGIFGKATDSLGSKTDDIFK